LKVFFSQLHSGSFIHLVPLIGMRFWTVPAIQNIQRDSGSILQTYSPQIALDEKPEFARKPQKARTVAVWLNLQHGQHRLDSRTMGNAASLVWNLLWLRYPALYVTALVSFAHLSQVLRVAKSFINQYFYHWYQYRNLQLKLAMAYIPFLVLQEFSSLNPNLHVFFDMRHSNTINHDQPKTLWS
jgi:hypothetical protein